MKIEQQDDFIEISGWMANGCWRLIRENAAAAARASGYPCEMLAALARRNGPPNEIDIYDWIHARNAARAYAVARTSFKDRDRWYKRWLHDPDPWASVSQFYPENNL